MKRPRLGAKCVGPVEERDDMMAIIIEGTTLYYSDAGLSGKSQNLVVWAKKLRPKFASCKIHKTIKKVVWKFSEVPKKAKFRPVLKGF